MNSINKTNPYDHLNGITLASFEDCYEANSLTHIVSYRSCILETSTFLKLSSIYKADYAIDCFATDNIENKFRFTLTYLVQNSIDNVGYRIVTKTTDTLAVSSLQHLYPAFNWAEREVWDLMGLFFTNHADLRRILTDYGFSGHPLRKDFPVSGFREVHYADSLKQIVYNDVELSQGLRLPTAAPVWLNEKA